MRTISSAAITTHTTTASSTSGRMEKDTVDSTCLADAVDRAAAGVLALAASEDAVDVVDGIDDDDGFDAGDGVDAGDGADADRGVVSAGA